MKYKMMLDKNNKLISEVYKKDNRFLVYLMEDTNKNQYWLLKSEIIKLLSLNDIENLKLVGKNLVPITNLDIKKFKITDKDFLNSYIKMRIDKCKRSKVYVNIHDYERLLQSGVLDRLLSSKDYVVGGVFNDKHLIKLFVVSVENNLNMIHIFEMKELENDYKCLEIIVNYFNNSILCNLLFSSVGLERLRKLGFHDINKIALFPKQYGIEEEYMYHLNKFYLTNKNPDILVKAIESNYSFVNKKDIKIECFTAEKLLNFLYPVKTEIFNDMERIDTTMEWCLRNRSLTVVGFDIFNLSDVINKADRKNVDIKYLVAYSGKKVLGIIKFGYWSSAQIFSYIDVCLPCRRMGISTMLLKNLSKYLDTDYPIMITSETELGKKCKMIEKTKKYIHGLPVYSEDEACCNPRLLDSLK